jgi:hypothetical protein
LRLTLSMVRSSFSQTAKSPSNLSMTALILPCRSYREP